MALRNIVKIDEEKCNGCGQCIDACAEKAIQLIDGKAKLVSEIYCDGLGACIGHCPQDAITIEKRESAEFDEKATHEYIEKTTQKAKTSQFSCPGMMAQTLEKKTSGRAGSPVQSTSELAQWPVQLSLVPPTAPYFQNADLILVADCVPFAMPDFHDKFLKNHAIAVGCPKLDDVQFYIDKFAQILTSNKISSLTVIHMQVPCCSGLTYIAKQAIAASDPKMSFKDVTISLQGDIMKTETVNA
jgi:ferredoxin